MISAINTSSRPPENATGNYVKIVQRVPVRIRFNPNQRNLDKLRPGMSVEPRVHPTLFHLRMAFWTEASAAPRSEGALEDIAAHFLSVVRCQTVTTLQLIARKREPISGSPSITAAQSRK